MESAAWSPQPGPQADAISATWCEELLFGGAKYGGKTDQLLGDYLQDVPRYKQDWHGILFRRHLPELEEIIRRSHEIYPLTGAEWGEQKKTWHWPKLGASLKLRQIERRADIGKYQGHSYGWIGFDEGTNWADDSVYRQVGLANLRWAGAEIPTKRIRMTANPGGAGHRWVYDYFIAHAPQGFVPFDDPDTGMTRMFIPSRITDNVLGVKRDPGYLGRLRGLGSPEMVKAWLEGDWNVVAGAYFSEFSDEHVIQPFPIPDHWMRFCSFDWGGASPFAVLWFAVSDGSHNIPSGSLVVYREWYGADSKGAGLKMLNEHIARGILSKEAPSEKIQYRVADPAVFNEQGGPSIAHVMAKEGCRFKPADNDRISGWGQVHSRLQGQDGYPRLYIFSTCTNLIRTLPLLQHDEKHPEDLNTEQEDHLADALRYGCKTRPYIIPAPARDKGEILVKKPTFNDLLKVHDMKQGARKRI